MRRSCKGKVQHLTRNDFATALELLRAFEQRAGDDALGFARLAVTALCGYVPAELSTLSVCDLQTGHRQVVGLPGRVLSAGDVDSFDRHFHQHPLVRFHGHGCQAVVRRLSDEIPAREFRRSALYADYYRRIGIEYVIAMPLLMNGRTLVSLVLNRSRLDFSERERERLELLRPHLAYLYRQACRVTRAQGKAPAAAGLPGNVAAEPNMLPQLPQRPGLTVRESQVVQWLACGKTDSEIAALLGLSPRTVQKHLEHVYIKLGVETRTAAVMRMLDQDLSGRLAH